MKVNDICPFREGVTLNRPTKESEGSWVDIGLLKDCKIDVKIQEGVRVTVKLDNYDVQNPKCKLNSLQR